MADAHALGEVIAERAVTFTRADGSAEVVTVRVGKPVVCDVPDEWRCPYQIDGFSGVKTFRMIGVDSVQALLLTLQTILPELQYLAEREGAVFSWLEAANAGFPDYQLSPAYRKRNGA